MLPVVLLFGGLLCHGKSTAAPQAFGLHRLAAEETPTFRLLHICSFANHSWAQALGSAWLDGLQTHGWDSALGTIRFIKPWSRGNFTTKQLKNLQSLLQLYFHGFTREVQAYASQIPFAYPFELQIMGGCRLHTGQLSESFLYGAYQGSDFLSFQGNLWKPSPGAGTRAQKVCSVLNHYRDIKEIVQDLLSVTCPQFLAGLLVAGKSELERQVKPEVWLSRGPSPGPGRQQLVCHVSGFHPKPVWVMWMRGDQEQKSTRRDVTLPNADGTWYLRASLDVAASKVAGLSCRVKHSSLGGRDIIIHWGSYSILKILMCLSVIVTLVALLVLDLGSKKHGSNQNIFSSQISKPAFPLEVHNKCPRSSAHQLCFVRESWIKRRISKLRTSLKQLW